MPRVPEAEIARIKREVDLVELVGRSGVELKRRGKDLAGLCPFHDDTEPSLVVTPSKNLWHCLGSCQAGGSVIDWVMRFEGISFRKAVELLRRDYQPSVEALTEKPVKHSLALKFDALATPEVGDAELLGRVIDFYHRTLLESPEALAYLEERGLSATPAASSATMTRRTGRMSRVDLRFLLDPATDEPHIYEHGVSEDEVEEVLANPADEFCGARRLADRSRADRGRPVSAGSLRPGRPLAERLRRDGV